jgi:tetratricopeptide (TPR) repeat protein
MVSSQSAFFAGDYAACVEAASLESSTAEARSLWCRALVHLGRFNDAKSVAKNNSALDRALYVYADAFSHRNNSLDSSMLSKLEAASALEGDRDEAAVILATVYNWAGYREEAFRLASQSASLEGQLLLVTILISLGRFDLAERKLEKLKKAHVDKIAFQLVEAELALNKVHWNVELTNGKGRG